MFGPESFMGHLFQESPAIQAWVYWMMLINTAAIVLVKTTEGKIIFGVWIANIVTMMALFQAFGWVKLLGLSHVLWWTPLAGYLLIQATGRTRRNPLKAYLWVLLITILISLVFDYHDLYLYLSGGQIAA